MRTNTYLFIICLLLPICQSCIKELHDLPPRPEITVKLNGIIQDTIIIAPGEDVNIEVECNAQKGILQEVTIKDKVSTNLPGFPLTEDSSLLQNKSSYSYRFNANDYMADGGQAYQTYNFQVICQDNNNPKQLRSKTISILVAEELKSYTITLGAQDNKEHGGFLNVSTGKSYTLEEVRQMNMKELLEISLCYFWGEEGVVPIYEQNQRFIPLVGTYYYTTSWYSYLSQAEYTEIFKPYSIPLIEQIPVDENSKMSIQFPYLLKAISGSPFEDYNLTTDLLKYAQTSSTTLEVPVVYGIYIFTECRYTNWPEDQSTQQKRPHVIRINSLVPGPQGSITLDIKASTDFNY